MTVKELVATVIDQHQICTIAHSFSQSLQVRAHQLLSQREQHVRYSLK